MEKTEDWVLDSALESVDFAEEAVLRAAGTLEWADPSTKEEDLHRIGMSVRECMVNAVVHGNRYNAKKKVGLRVSTTPERLTIEIWDEGEGFEMSTLPDPLADDNLLRHSGRGLFLMAAFMDDVKVQKVSPSGTEVTLIKKFGPPE